MAAKEAIKTHQTTARIVGAVYLAGFVVGIGGEMLIQSALGAPGGLSTISANSLALSIGALLWLLAVVGDAAHGVLMFPILKQHSERIAVGYLAARIVDAMLITIMVLFILLQLPLGDEYLNAAALDTSHLQALSTLFAAGQHYAYQIGMSALGISGLMLCYTLYRAKLVPQLVAIWGLVGYAIIFCGMLSEIMGSGLGLASSIPGGLWEIFIGVWLIVKGFRSSALAAEPAKAAANTSEQISLAKV